jgi:uncharacterized protein
MGTILTEHPNAALVRREYEAFNNADLETLSELFDKSASWHTWGEAPRRRPRGTRTRPKR